jgi:hypothetical protein
VKRMRVQDPRSDQLTHGALDQVEHLADVRTIGREPCVLPCRRRGVCRRGRPKHRLLLLLVPSLLGIRLRPTCWRMDLRYRGFRREFQLRTSRGVVGQMCACSVG